MSESEGLDTVWRGAWKTAKAVPSALLVPALHLWPWLVADLAFAGYLLGTSQGSANAAEMSKQAWVSWPSLQALTVSFACALAASLFTSLVVTSFSDPAQRPPLDFSGPPDPRWPAKVGRGLERVRKFLVRGRVQGALHLLWGFGLAVAAPLVLLLTAWPAEHAWWVVSSLSAVSVLIFVLLGRGWASEESWANRLRTLRGCRFALGGLILVTAVTPLLTGALVLERDPL